MILFDRLLFSTLSLPKGFGYRIENADPGVIGTYPNMAFGVFIKRLMELPKSACGSFIFPVLSFEL
jgi:hypothetical protein